MYIMRINSINNSQINFKGKFKKNELLNSSLEKASDYDLKKFAELLRRMKTQKDDLVFSINSDEYNIRNSFFKKFEIELLKTGNKQCTGFIVGEETRFFKDDFLGLAFDNSLKKINKILEAIYPEQETTKVKRENSLAKIYKNLD